MPTAAPIACTLTSTQLPTRLAEIRTLGRASLVSSKSDRYSAVLRFCADAQRRERLKAIVAAEAKCCAFLQFALSEESGALVLTVRAPEDGESVLHELVAAFGGDGAEVA